MAAEPGGKRSRLRRDEERSGSAGEDASPSRTGGSLEDPHGRMDERESHSRGAAEDFEEVKRLRRIERGRRC